jgi:hypothetical protein
MIARWFAKRFLHPDIVSEYGYIFLWDEDLGVEDFHPEQYVDYNLLCKGEKKKKKKKNGKFQNSYCHQSAYHIVNLCDQL